MTSRPRSNHNPSLRLNIGLNVALGRAQGRMSRQRLHKSCPAVANVQPSSVVRQLGPLMAAQRHTQ